MPGSGGSYVYLREAYGRERFGRLVAFLFIWQFILSGPLEIASGYIGFSRYARYIWPDLTSGHVFPRCGRRGCPERHPALPADRGHRHAHCQPVARHAADDGSRDCRAARSISTRRVLRLSSGRVRFLARVPARTWRGVARRDLRLSGLLRHLLHRRRSQGARAGHSAVDPDQHRRGGGAFTWRSTSRSSASCPWREFVPADAHPKPSSSSRRSWSGSTDRGLRRCSRF